MTKILIVASNIHKKLAAEQLAGCEQLIKKSRHDYQVELVEAGTYELPFVINSYHSTKPYDGYIALGLVLKSNPDHYGYILSHIKRCFTEFALRQIPVGNGIISGDSLDSLAAMVASADPCLSAYPSAFRAVDYLIGLKDKLRR